MTTEIELWQPEMSEPPEIPALWDFQAADKKFNETVYSWRRLTTDVVTQLWIFYHKLARPGARTDLSEFSERLPTWLEWVKSKGISDKTPIAHFQASGWLPKRELLISDEPAKIKSGEYRTIIIDPPWPYETKYDSQTRRVASPYPEMTIEAIAKTPFPFADDCVLWLWTTHQFIWDAKELLNIWGFDYKAVLVWNKQKMGMGEWLRMQCEFCLLAIKGRPQWKSTNTRDIIVERGREHSRKPEAFYKMILDICPEPIGEGFGQKKRKGIKIVCGDQTDKF